MGNRRKSRKKPPFFGFVGMVAAWLGILEVGERRRTERRSQNACPNWFRSGSL